VGQLKDTADLAVYLVKPAYGLSTGSIFKALDYDALSTVDPDELLNAFQEKGTDHDLWINDLEQPAFEVEPNLGELKASLESADFGFKAVLMSGSGSTIYCLGEPAGGEKSFKDAITANFQIEGIWRTKLLRRKSMDEWYAAPNA